MKIKNPQLLFFMVVLILLLPLSLVHGKSKKKLDVLLEQKKFRTVEKFCAKLKGKKQKECYRHLADAYFAAGDYLKAADCFEKCGGREGFNRIGDAFLKMKEYKTALEYFEKGAPSPLRAAAYEHLADYYRREGDNSTAKEYYNKAILEYEFLLKNFNCEWKNEYFDHMKRCLAKRHLFEKNSREKKEQALLEKILKGAGNYCTRMKTSLFHFFCNEDIVTLKNSSREIEESKQLQGGGRWTRIKSSKISPVTRKYLYEYQLVREGDNFDETRTLLRKNGLKMKKPGAQLEISSYRFNKMIFGPIALLSPFWQGIHRYKIVKEDVLRGEQVVVIEAIPLRFSERNPLFGKIWVDKDDFSVLKIQWNPKSMDFYGYIEQRGRAYDSTPEVAFFAEFNIKKNGIRFPSRYYLEESYIDEKGKTFVYSKLDVKMKDYRFFVVGTEVINAEPDLPPTVAR